MGYVEPTYPPKPCWRCRWRRHDTEHREQWCAHVPLPGGIPASAIIQGNGTCECWESWPGREETDND